MNAEMRRRVTSSPFMTPATAPIASAIGTATAVFMPPRRIISSTDMPAINSTEPTERSMPPPIRTNVSPIAMMPRIERSRSVSLRL